MSTARPEQAPGRDKFDAWFDDANAERDRLTERVAELVTEGNELRALAAEVIDAYDAITACDQTPGDEAQLAEWRKRAGLASEPAAVTAGAEHLAAEITRLAIGDEES